MNMYAYAGGDPVNGSDPSGKWTFQLGGGGQFMAGPLAIGGYGGVAIDGQGSIGLYGTIGGSGGAGLDANVALQFQGSNGDSIKDLKGPFLNAGVGGGAIGHIGADAFTGTGQSGQLVTGVGITVGGGAGVYAYGGASGTGIIPLAGPAATTNGDYTVSIAPGREQDSVGTTLAPGLGEVVVQASGSLAHPSLTTPGGSLAQSMASGRQVLAGRGASALARTLSPMDFAAMMGGFPPCMKLLQRYRCGA